MKKEEKTERTRERILAAAIEEFGKKGYAAATMGAICDEYAIAKGLLYHNFKGKDELYLACVSRCFASLTDYLREQAIGADLHRYMEQRLRYFAQHPLYAALFFEAVLQPPAALAAEIREKKKALDQFNRGVYQAALSRVVLREGVTETEAMEFYEMIQEMFNGYFSSPAYAGGDVKRMAADHEDKLAKLLDLMLYGIAERGAVK